MAAGDVARARRRARSRCRARRSRALRSGLKLCAGSSVFPPTTTRRLRTSSAKPRRARLSASSGRCAPVRHPSLLPAKIVIGAGAPFTAPNNPTARSGARFSPAFRHNRLLSMRCHNASGSRNIPFSVLDLYPHPRGRNSRRRVPPFARSGAARGALGLFALLARRASQHMTGIASAATSVVIGHIAGGNEDHPRRPCGRPRCRTTRRCFVIAEQFGTLASLHPTDVSTSAFGSRRAPDQTTARALRHDLQARARHVPRRRRRAAAVFRRAGSSAARARRPGAGA